MSQNVSEAKWDTLVRQSKDSNTKKKLSKDSKERTFVTPELFESNILEIPLILQTPEFVDCYIQWLEHLKEKKKLPTLSAVKQQLADCAGWGVYQAIRNLKFSIGKNYQGIFPDKTDKFHTPKENTLKDIPPDGGF